MIGMGGGGGWRTKVRCFLKRGRVSVQEEAGVWLTPEHLHLDLRRDRQRRKKELVTGESGEEPGREGGGEGAIKREHATDDRRKGVGMDGQTFVTDGRRERERLAGVHQVGMPASDGDGRM